jgi:hypothetical protein
LLLDEGAADELLQRPLPGELALTDEIRIENLEADFVVEIAGQDGMLVDHGDHAVEDDGGGRVWLLGEDRRQSRKEQRKSERFCRSGLRKSNRSALDCAFRDYACCDGAPRAAQDDSRLAGSCDSNWGALVHQKACPRLKKKLMCGAWPK